MVDAGLADPLHADNFEHRILRQGFEGEVRMLRGGFVSTSCLRQRVPILWICSFANPHLVQFAECSAAVLDLYSQVGASGPG
mmetsp:Transcript_52102/g.131677  ORF Transcript_52102/g.131677 Transcript_52102/m.131677 type:complete len:82 (+) Transcript_52102:116-361(+)